MMKMSKREYQALLRQDLAFFVPKVFHTLNPGTPYLPNWHIEAICYHLQLCLEGKINRLIITIPPRHLKSIIASVAFIAWVLGRDPTRQIFCASYSQVLSNKHSRDTRIVMESDWYKTLFPFTRIDRNKNTESEFVTTRQGYRLATSVGGTLTGRGGNMLIVDDALKADDAHSETALITAIEWFTGTALSRLNNKVTDPIILIQQRLSEKDLAGYLLDTGGWVHLNIPAIAEEFQRIQIGKDTFYVRHPGDILHPKREPRELLDKMKKEMGSYSFAAQYQQRPAPKEGGLVKWPWFQRYAIAPVKGGARSNHPKLGYGL